MKDAARLLAYLAAVLLFGALAAPPLYWAGHSLGESGRLAFLAQIDFERFFHRALLVGALIFFWPLLRALRIRSWRELGLVRNERAARDVAIGFAAAAIPLLCFAVVLLGCGVYSLRGSVGVGVLLGRSISAIVVPFIEEPLFRGLILGVLLRACSPTLAIFFTSAFFSVLHFLKAPPDTSAVVNWSSGFVSIAHAFQQFTEPLLVLAGFTTLFLLGWILADARLRTRSLWLPIGLHGGWIFISAIFNKLARRELELLPWLGQSLLIGLAPLALGLLTWAIVRAWIRHVESPIA
ncbi:MAG: CPBP family intramembrane glutamic endopeptidase [Chthoniobacterales bacterium]